MSIRRILGDVISFWKDIGTPKDLIQRDIEIKLRARDITVITGVRRSGKTYLLFQIMKKLIEKGVPENNIFYINFEDERIPPKTEVLTELIPTIVENYAPQGEIYLLLDEIHRIPSWSSWLHRQHARGIHLYITGSTTELQPDKIPKNLRGRTLTYTIYPLSFKEYLKFKGVRITSEKLSEEKRALVRRYIKEYLLYGGFPEVVLGEDIEYKIRKLHEYFRTIIYRDIVEAHRIRNIPLLETITKLLINSTIFGTRKFYNTLKSLGYKTSTKTVIEYKKAIENSYMIKQVEIYSHKIKNKLQYPKKIYCIDQGLRNAISTTYKEKMGRLLENAIYIELLRRKQLNTEINYWKTEEGYEIDFIISKGIKPTEIIQVAYELGETTKREERALIKAMKQLNIKKGYIITNIDHKETVEKNNKKIIYTPIHEYLLKKNNSKNRIKK